ncbi:fungal-specific transcription factor domain-containing protein [Aspergillus cavernicola]|uniref:Fungal-specific transcription factor domain-containing protein n=1 Tax=Aspergillus cavernicola TaxID=176166 RepID=A0ABR4INR1_9EURO
MDEPCYTCRRRRIQCDRSQLPCLKCQKAGLTCLDKRPVRWVQGVAIRGGMRGRLHQDDSVSSKPVGETLTRSTIPAELPHPPCPPSYMAVVPTEAKLTSVPLSMEDPAVSNLDATSRYYLNYYNDRICELFIVYDSQNNPFRSLISLALSDTVLLKAVLALAARHRTNFEQPFSTNGTVAYPISVNTEKDALHFKYHAIQGLSHSLNGGNSYQDATVASVFLLVFLDLIESGCDRWNYHLEGAKSLMALTPSHNPGHTLQRIRKFIVKQIHLIEALGATFVRPQLLSKSMSIEESPNLLQDVVEESFLGCPEYILTSLQYLSLQRDVMISGKVSDHTSIQDIISVFDGVEEFDCYSWASTLCQQSVTRDINDLCKLARTYQIGAILYGRRILDALLKEETTQELLVSELIGIINSLQHGSNLLKCTLWPITVAGLECHLQSQRDTLMHALEQFWMDTRCLNVTNAAKILQTHWQKIDDQQAVANDWIFDIGRMSHDWLLI